MNKVKRLEILARLRGSNPHPTTESNFTSPFELLISVLPSIQAIGVSVSKVTVKLYPITNMPVAMLEFGVEGVKSYIKTIGLLNSKTENVVKTYCVLPEQHDGETSEGRTTLEILPGVGRGTVSAVLNTAFDWPTIAVDTHVFRVCNRIQFAPGKSVEQVEEKLLEVAPSEFKVDCHHWLVLHGRYTCIARKPRCGSCITKDPCESKGEAGIQRYRGILLDPYIHSNQLYTPQSLFSRQ